MPEIQTVSSKATISVDNPVAGNTFVRQSRCGKQFPSAIPLRITVLPGNPVAGNSFVRQSRCRKQETSNGFAEYGNCFPKGNCFFHVKKLFPSDGNNFFYIREVSLLQGNSFFYAKALFTSKGNNFLTWKKLLYPDGNSTLTWEKLFPCVPFCLSVCLHVYLFTPQSV